MTPPQHITALNEANRIRIKRAEAKRNIAALSYAEGREECARWLEADPDFLASMRVMDLLGSVHRFGPKAARAVVKAAGCSEWTTVGGVTPRQRAGLCAALRLDLRLRQAWGDGRAA